jgi:hypothetical protein
MPSELLVGETYPFGSGTMGTSIVPGGAVPAPDDAVPLVDVEPLALEPVVLAPVALDPVALDPLGDVEPLAVEPVVAEDPVEDCDDPVEVDPEELLFVPPDSEPLPDDELLLRQPADEAPQQARARTENAAFMESFTSTPRE